MFLTSLFFIDTLILLALALFLLHKYISRNFDYWEKKKVFYIQPKPFVGNFYQLLTFQLPIGDFLAKLYNSTKEPFFGIFVFGTPYLIIRSPEVIKSILVKDFDVFPDRTILSSEYDPLLAHMIFFEKNPDWKVMRSKLTPLFSSGKLKLMLNIMKDIAEEMISYVDRNLTDKPSDAKDLCSRYATDVIAKCAFAIRAHCFDRENNDFRKIGNLIFGFSWLTAFQQTSYFFFPEVAKLLRLRFVPEEVTDFLRKVFWQSINKRENGGTKANDLIDLLVELKQDEEFCANMKFENDKVVAQAAQFYAAGFETTSSTISFTLYELCLHPHIQRKVRLEMDKMVQKHGGINYEAIQDMKYLNMVVCEILRKYPVLPFLDRRCVKDYKIPGSSVVIEKGTPVYIPMFGLHYDPEYFPNPKKFIPERFSDENLETLKQFAYLPFGQGPRICIGERFGLLGTKLCLVYLLTNFEVDRADITPVPLEFDPKSFVLASKVGLPMIFRRIKKS